ncbi:glycosyltransferase family 4 protein [Vampirovibrio sp.]|uniref:glycosyltransferase family 4 protein n=1 Tax=Vampirovibrio sp. TaxID=2717857 RepID=UPI0035931C58
MLGDTPSTGYLISQYPSRSHTFILREIQEIERLGLPVKVASINQPDRAMDAMMPDEQQEAARTHYIKSQGAAGALRALVQEFKANPVGVLKGLAGAIRLGRSHPKTLLIHLAYYAEAVMVACWMRRNQLRHLHVHFAQAVCTVGMLTKLINGCQYSFTVHGPDEFSNVEHHRLREKFAMADRIIAITYYAQSQIMLHANSEDWGKILIVRVGLDCEPFLMLAAERIKHHAARGVPEILSIGRLSPAKGQLVLLKALASLKLKNVSFHLTLVGTGPLHALLENEAKRLGLDDRHLTFAGGKNQDEIHALIRESDLFALSSFAEGLPVVLMEALLAELPVVTTTITGIPELIQHEREGLLVAAGDSEGFAEALQHCLTHTAEAQAMAQSGQKRVLELHDIHVTGRQLYRCFTELANRDSEIFGPSQAGVEALHAPIVSLAKP